MERPIERRRAGKDEPIDCVRMCTQTTRPDAQSKERIEGPVDEGHSELEDKTRINHNTRKLPEK